MIPNTPVLTLDQSLLQCDRVNELKVDVLWERHFGSIPSLMCVTGYKKEISKHFNEKNGFKFMFGAYYPYDEKNSSFELFPTEHTYSYLYYYYEATKIILKVRVEKTEVSLDGAGPVDKLEELFKTFEESKIPKSKTEIGILCQDNGNVYVKKVKIEEMKMDLELNYGSGFKIKHELVISKMRERRGGLYMFHGPPSGGKTSYIKYLSQQLDRLFIFIPTNQLDALTNPSILSVLLDNPDSVLILEDAEKAIVSRETSDNPPIVSVILNLTDGILSSMLGTSLIVTYNTARETIDQACLRKGRLFVEHCFSELSIEDAQNVATKLGKTIQIDKPMMLGDIYNWEEETFHQDPPKSNIGFGKS